MKDGLGRSHTFRLKAPFVKLELFECRSEACFLVTNGFLGINEFLLLQSDPLRVKPDTVLDL